MDNGLVSGFEPSGYPQQIYGSEPKLEIPRTGGMISSDVLPDNSQLKPCSDEFTDNGFLHSENDPDTPSLPPGLEENDHNDFCRVDFDEDSSMPLIVDLATVGLRILARLAVKPPNKSTALSCKTIMKYFCIYGIDLDSLWLPRESYFYSRAQHFVNASVNSFQSVNNNFDNTLNSLHPMTLLT